MSIDSQGGAILILLDLSAAFDTIDHNILLKRLYNLGVQGSALQWFQSYLVGRKQSVTIDDVRSNERNLHFGVPQGSVLGPILFTLYTRPLGLIALKYNLQYHLYADDTQLYISFKPGDEQSIISSISQVEQCVNEIKQWMCINKLKLNDDKTELLVITNKWLKVHHPISSIKIGASSILPSECIRNLGSFINNTLDTMSFVNLKCRAAFHTLYNISKIRNSLTTETTKTLVQALVTSKLDYCNSLLYGTPAYLLYRLQKAQNYAARLTCRIRKREHITPILSQLHWLPIKHRIDFKMLMFVFKCQTGSAPEYLQSLIKPYKPARDLRSAECNFLQDQPARLKSYGERSFAAAAPVLWNNLPDSIRHSTSLESFKKNLKTHLYLKAYPD